MNIKVGDVVRVISGVHTFGDYRNGDIGEVVGGVGKEGFNVRWTKRSPETPEHASKESFVFHEEVEVI